MKKLLSILFAIVLIFSFAGCAKKKLVQPKPKNADENHIVVDQKDLKLAVSNRPKNMKGLINASNPGDVIVTIYVKVYNHSTENTLHISPDFVSIVTDKNNTYKWNQEDAAILTKMAFKEIEVPKNDQYGGGALPFEIKDGETVTKLIYNDVAGHNITIDYTKGDSKI